MKLKVSQAAEVRLGRQRSPQFEIGEHQIPYMRSANIDQSGINVTDVKSMNFTPDEQSVFGLESGDVLVTEGSGSRASVGMPAVWEGQLAGTVCFQNTLLRLRPRAGLTDGRYLAWWARHAHASGQIAEAASGANILHLGSDGLKRLEMHMPTLDEQQRVADFLDDQVSCIDSIVAAREASLRSVDAMAASRRRVAILGPEDHATDLQWASMVGTDRQVRRLSQLARLGTGHTPSRRKPEYWESVSIPWLTTADVHKFRGDQISVLHETELEISDLGLANSAAVLHPAGTVALSRTASAGFAIVMGEDMATSQDFATWTCGQDLRPEFLLGTLRVMRDYLLRYLSMGSTHKTIYFPDLEAIRIVVPGTQAQERAVAELRKIDGQRSDAKSTLMRQIALLTEYKRSLIAAAVTGELDVATASKRVPA